MTVEDQRQYGATPGERRAYELFQLKRAVRRLLRAQKRAMFARWRADYYDAANQAANDFWREGWRRASHKWRAEVRKLIA